MIGVVVIGGCVLVVLMGEVAFQLERLRERVERDGRINR